MGSTSNRISGWSAIRKRWKAKYLPDDNGNYECAICHQPVHISVVSLDHIAPVELYPEYAKELSNLQPTHTFCNQERAFSTVKMLKGRRIIGINKPKGRRR